MAGSKSTQTRFVKDKHLLYIPTLAFLNLEVAAEVVCCQIQKSTYYHNNKLPVALTNRIH